jgi:regulator of sirC expression with transglutaminase-like and TPR domain
MVIDDALHTLSVDPHAAFDVAEVALWLARDEYPHLDVDAYLAELDGLAHEAKSYVRGDVEARVAGLCRYLFHEAGFRGNLKDYYDPRNSYLNQVLDRMTGIPITLSVVAMAVGQRVGLEVHCIGLPGHVVALCPREDEPIVFDPFHGGRRLSATDCENVVRQVTGLEYAVTPLALQPMPLGQLVQRMLNNLRGIYLKGSDWLRAITVLRRLRQLQPREAALQRDLGICMMHAGQPAAAFDHLSRYLRDAPDAGDVEQVRVFLLKAEREIARWN